ncbi:hypothetical protein C8F01DRAFT_1247542 [Mycena amicta]|nr:hypothetical protein C8F01DRAFT_1247542 [Mycena amicta]
MASLRPQQAQDPDSLIRRSWHAMTDMLSPFSSSALAQLPARQVRYTRADNIPETEPNDDGQRPAVRDYLSINHPCAERQPPRPEEGRYRRQSRGKALFNASKDPIARAFAYVYALISVGVLIYGYVLYQHRITMIRRRDPGHFDMIIGPVGSNFMIRVREL